MNRFCFILTNSKKNIVDYCRVDSDRFQLLKSVLSNENDEIKENQKINFSKEKLQNKIITLLNNRLNKITDIDYGNRFDKKYLYQIVIFEGKTIRLKTSGIDNLIIFAVNIYNNLDKGLTVKYSKYKRLIPPS